MAISLATSGCVSTLPVVQGFSVRQWFVQEAIEMTSCDTRTGSTKQEQPTYSAVELMKLPLKERLKILACTAMEAEVLYASNKRLTDFEAFGEDDLYDTTP
ncbi:MAG: hypothetical protein U9Q94_02315 [Candidatus Bipolaricaulota bacterium]|nr:hypothetical protein [Candidatus Bipolaricaulota bacterium]